MRVQQVSMRTFRNYEELELELAPGINVLHGDNAQGKTNFLEAIYMCATGRSQRTANMRELIMLTKPDAHARTTVLGENAFDRIDVHLRKDDAKGIALNGLTIRKLGQLFGTLLVVIFSPEDLRLLKSGPGERRKFLDTELCQLSASYYNDLRQYYHVLKQRNNLLKSARSDRRLLESVFVWNEQLVRSGVKIIFERAEFIKELDALAAEAHAGITRESGGERLGLVYKPCVTAEEFSEKLNKGLDRDIMAGTTCVGIHRDDIAFTINGGDARFYGSQGQQRTACLAVKLAEIKLIVGRTNKNPVLLLDDVLSELDEARQKYLLELSSGVQTVITCAGALRADIKRAADAVFKVESGRIIQRS